MITDTAKFIVVEPKDKESWTIEPGYLRDAMESKPLKIDQLFDIPYFGKTFTFEVLYIKPKRECLVTNDTAFVIQKIFDHLCPMCGSKLEWRNTKTKICL